MKKNNKSRSREDLYKKLGERPVVVKKKGATINGANKEKLSSLPLSYKTKDEIRELVSRLVKLGYTPIHGLDSIKDDDHIVAIVVNNKDKVIHQTNVTCMACWCSKHNGRPLSVMDALDNFETLFIEHDLKFYHKLLSKKKGH